MLTADQGTLVAHLQVNELSCNGFMVAPSTFTAAEPKNLIKSFVLKSIWSCLLSYIMNGRICKKMIIYSSKVYSEDGIEKTMMKPDMSHLCLYFYHFYICLRRYK